MWFFPEAAGASPSPASIDTDGSYQIVNFPPGPVKIAVEGPGRSSDPSKPAPQVILPPRYRDATQSGLTYTVKPGKQEFPIELSGK